MRSVFPTIDFNLRAAQQEVVFRSSFCAASNILAEDSSDPPGAVLQNELECFRQVKKNFNTLFGSGCSDFTIERG